MKGTVSISIDDYNALLTGYEHCKNDYEILINGILEQAELLGDKGSEFLYWAGSGKLRVLLQSVEPKRYEQTLAKLIKEKENKNEKSTELPL